MPHLVMRKAVGKRLTGSARSYESAEQCGELAKYCGIRNRPGGTVSFWRFQTSKLWLEHQTRANFLLGFSWL